ncbi:MAG TPA: Fe-S cluster assembly protein HesB [Patescibacteria group bacterium]|nr:Fe-S cluster assembly protein HesB [Patescibacteria group bacterium]
MKLNKKQITDFQLKIFTWWEIHKRDLPWRHTRDPYRIFVSEVMLQQTQVLRVIPKYREFIKRFPTISDLANASAADVLRLWKGMGYNRRALFLYNAAHKIVEHYKSEFPVTEAQLSKLPGVGIYTARAILVFSFGENIALVDTNIRRIITHFFFRGLPQKEKIIQEVADQLVPKGKSWEWHQALMDYGAIGLKMVRGYRAQGIEKQKRNSQLYPKPHAPIPFKDSTRYFRGRIVDYLREGNKDEAELISYASHTFGKTNGFYMSIISSLIKDGLIVRQGKSLALPE